MNNGIIIYKSKYGTTKKYAEWLAKEINYDIIEYSKAKINQITKYQNIIFCGAIYASGISCLSILKKNNIIDTDSNNQQRSFWILK